MKILALETFYAGSHQSWLDSLKQYSSHDIDLLTLPGRHWKWRMYGGAVSLAREFNKINTAADLILASDMLDLSTFLALTRQSTAKIPVVIYFHENQFSYPWSQRDPDLQHNRDKQYGFINYTSALAADHCFFNSDYHLKSFIIELQKFAKQAPDKFHLETIAEIKAKSSVLYLGLDLKQFLPKPKIQKSAKPKILWNHRWEYDKNPDDFFKALRSVKDRGLEFELILLGESYQEIPREFELAIKEFKAEIIHLGYVESFQEYKNLLWQADILPVTSIQDFFGASIVEAISCETYPILPNRLTYPELLPSDCEEVFYNNQSELVFKLENAINNFRDIQTKTLTDYAYQFDWGSQIKIYDQKFQSLV